MDELLGFLGVNYISNGEGDVVGRDGVLYTWALEEHLDYLPSYQVDLPRGLPVSLWRNIDGDYTGTLSGAVAFVTAQADAQHGGVVSFRRPGLAGRLRDSNGMVRFVGTQGDECPLLIWERTENRELLLGALLKVPHERYPVVHCDTAGRWVALDFADPLDAVEVTAHIGNVAAPLGAFATHLPAVIWVPYAASALTFKKPQRSLRVQIADEAELRVLL